MSDIANQALFIFDCPIHGVEIEAFCFRAVQDENKSRWNKYILVETPITEEDIEAAIKIILEKA